jgi:translation initiation factor 2 alpha subunit (eIF-2alpha)
MDLTCHGLKEEDIQSAEKIYNEYKSLMSLLYYVSKETQFPFQTLYLTISYPLHQKYGNGYLALQ